MNESAPLLCGIFCQKEELILFRSPWYIVDGVENRQPVFKAGGSPPETGRLLPKLCGDPCRRETVFHFQLSDITRSGLENPEKGIGLV